jgi:hypothetical protein
MGLYNSASRVSKAISPAWRFGIYFFGGLVLFVIGLFFIIFGGSTSPIGAEGFSYAAFGVFFIFRAFDGENSRGLSSNAKDANSCGCRDGSHDQSQMIPIPQDNSRDGSSVSMKPEFPNEGS